MTDNPYVGIGDLDLDLDLDRDHGKLLFNMIINDKREDDVNAA